MPLRPVGPADLATLVAQLAAPRRLLGATSPPAPLGPVEIEDGAPLVLRGAGTSFLTVETS
jgi:hypothetical protein